MTKLLMQHLQGPVAVDQRPSSNVTNDSLAYAQSNIRKTKKE